LPAPTEISAILAWMALMNAGSWYPLPWWATFSTSAVRSVPLRNRSLCASNSMSPVARIDTSPTLIRATTEELLGSERVPT
jgi:hypothetical protein